MSKKKKEVGKLKNKFTDQDMKLMQIGHLLARWLTKAKSKNQSSNDNKIN